MSFKQLAADIASLEQQVERVSLECAKLTVSNEFVGMDGKPESSEAPFTASLLSRLNNFLENAAPKLEALRSQYQGADCAVRVFNITVIHI